jgi:hypothetical protein
VKRLLEIIAVTIRTQVHLLRLSSEPKWSSRKCYVNVRVITLRNLTKPTSLDCRFRV